MRTLFDDDFATEPDPEPAPIRGVADRPPPTLRPYQLDVLERARRRIAAGGRRGVIQGECGSGKTVVIAELCRCAEAKGTRVLVLADRRRLIKQIQDTLRWFGVDPGIALAGQTQGLYQPVVVAGRDTLAAWRRHGRQYTPRADVVLIDECHRAMGQTYQDLLALYPQAWMVGFTATPARGDGKSLGDFFGWIEPTVPASQLIREGYLIRPEVYNPPELALRRKQSRGEGLAGDPVAQWKRHAAGLPTIAFSRSVKDSIDLRDRFLAAGIAADHIDSTADDDAREAAFRRLERGQTQVLSSVKLLIEGVDLPFASAVILWSRFGSLVEYKQATGRVMRPAPGKTRAVVLDHSGASGEHGLPGDDVEWSLDANSTVDQRRKKALDEGRAARPVSCRACGLVFSGEPRCPSCGWVVPKVLAGKPKDPARVVNEDLERVDGADVFGQAEARQRGWYQCLATARKRGLKAGAAAAMFRTKFGVPPWEAGVRPLPDHKGDWQRPAADVFPLASRA
ncbi:MAG TPA: DEAD/DEAH box helicase family protein [bacterium]|nr:DEAD/DEAH box helicase family protein [bacterium]